MGKLKNMEFDRFAPTLGQNGIPCAILPPMVCFVINKTDQIPIRSNNYSCE